jgi:DNA-binding NarL/FixJ family response regulator
MERLQSHLSEREQQLLALMLNGTELTTIARTLGISYSSAAVRLFRLREKLRHLSDVESGVLKL